MIRNLPFILLILFNGVVWSQQSVTNTTSGERPNIIFILTDDQRFDALGYYGNELAYTPAMDKLAKEGVYFKNALVTTPICAASRATLLTGLYERTHGYNFQTSGIKDEFIQNAYPKLLKEAGYYTGFYGKLGVRTDQHKNLFNVYDEYDRNNRFKDYRGYYYKTIDKDTVHLTRYTGHQASNFIEQAPKNQPFCLSLSFSAPHAHDGAKEQYFWQEASASILKDKIVPKPALGEDKYFKELPIQVQKGFNRTRWYWRYDTPEKYAHSVKGYYRMIAGVDAEIANIRKKLEEQGIEDNTIIILMGDNGYFLGERQLAGKWLMYDNSIRVPLIIYDPRSNNQKDVEQMALNVDVPATILDFAGVESPKSWQGKSLAPFVRSKNHNLSRDTVLIEHLWEFEHIPPSEGIRTADWKYLRYVNDQSLEELYYLKKDPQEINNLSASKKHQTILQQLREATNRLVEKYQDYTVGKPKNLMVEFIRKPTGVLLRDTFPEYGWQVSKGTGRQLGYQILVSSSKEKCIQNIGDIWDSGQVGSSKATNIEHEGKPLEAGSTYFWKVRIWDVYNRTSQYSAIQKFNLAGAGEMLTTPNIFQIEHIQPKALKKKGEHSYALDFGKAAFGTLQLAYESNTVDTLIIRLGEQLSNGRINQKPEGLIRYQEVKLPVKKGKDTYQIALKPDKRNTLPVAVSLPDTFPVIMPFRYCEIENAQSIISIADVTQIAYFTYFDEYQSSFTSSDTILNQVYDLCKYSIKATSFAGLYVDGDRERIPYEADAYLNQLSHYAVDAEYPIARSTIEYFMEYPTWPTEWQLHVALMFYEDYMYTGNKELLLKYYDKLKYKTLMELAREDGLISSTKATPDFMKKLGFKDSEKKLRDIVDWPPEANSFGGIKRYQRGEQDGYIFKPINTVINSFYYKNMILMAKMAEAINKPEEAAQFRMKALKVKSAINNILLDKERGIYIDGEGTDHAALHANMLPLAFGIVPQKYIPSVVKHIKSRGMACSVYGAQYLLDGLYNAGEEDYALELMTATHDRSWWNMIAIGSTITLEAWDMKYKANADWNHAWGAVPANVIARKMWGITPKTPGASIIDIKPQLSKLNHSTIEVPFLTGVVKASYKKEGARLQKYIFELPENVAGEVTINHDPNDSVKLNGELVNTAFGSIRLSSGKSEIEIKVNSF